MLSKKKYYSTLKYGYARGNEPVLYVNNIQYYKTYLQLHALSLQDYQPQLEEQSESVDWEINDLPSI